MGFGIKISTFNDSVTEATLYQSILDAERDGLSEILFKENGSTSLTVGQIIFWKQTKGEMEFKHHWRVTSVEVDKEPYGYGSIIKGSRVAIKRIDDYEFNNVGDLVSDDEFKDVHQSLKDVGFTVGTIVISKGARLGRITSIRIEKYRDRDKTYGDSLNNPNQIEVLS